MPRRKEHITAGVPAGAIAAVFQARAQRLPHIALEAVGGGVGGWIGSQMPDCVEPADCWNHRSFAHSWSALIGALKVSGAAIRQWEQFCRRKADAALRRRLSLEATGTRGNWFLVLQECLWRIAAGVLAGFSAGYVSHLVLDAFTKAGLPLAA